MDTAARLATRLDDLASSLVRCGAPPGEAQRLLETASLATLQAVSLDLLTAGREKPSALQHKVVGSAPAEPTVTPLAA